MAAREIAPVPVVEHGYANQGRLSVIISVYCSAIPHRETVLLLAERLTDRLARQFREVRRVFWRVQPAPPGRLHVSVSLTAASGAYTATATGPTVKDACQGVVARIALQRRRRKRMRIGGRRKLKATVASRSREGTRQ